MKLFFLCLSLLLHSCMSEDCSDEEYKIQEKEFEDCTTNYHYHINQLLQGEVSSDTQRMVCDYIAMAVDNCGKMLDKCHREENRDRMKDHLMEGLVSVGGTYSQECQVVVQFRSSNSQETINNSAREKDNSYSDLTYYSDYDETDNQEKTSQGTGDCSEAMMQRADDYMENCTSFIGTKTYNKLQAITDPTEVSAVLCSALADIDTDCVKYATSCLTPQYVSWFIDPIKKYLLDITATKVGEDKMPNCNSIDNKQDVINRLPEAQAQTQLVEHEEPYDTQESYDTQQAFNVAESHYTHDSTPENNYIGGHRIMNQVGSGNEKNYEDREVQDMASNVLKTCNEDELIEQMQECSHSTSINFRNNIQGVYESPRIHKTACEALRVIGTECVKDLEGCFSTVDIGQLAGNQVEHWRTYFTNLVNDGNGIRVNLDNCHSQKREEENVDEDRSRNDYKEDLRIDEYREDTRRNEYKEDLRRDDYVEDTRRSENRDDTRREEYGEDARYEHKEDSQMAEYRRRDDYDEHENTRRDEYMDNGNTRREELHREHKDERREEHREYEDTPYPYHSNNDPNVNANSEHCSVTNIEKAEEEMINCTQKIATKAYSQIYNSGDSVFISNVLCSTHARIDSDCIGDLKTCFSSQYISWLVEPIKTYLHNLAITKVSVESLQSCHDFNIQHYEATEDKRQTAEQSIESESSRRDEQREDERRDEYNEELRRNEYNEELRRNEYNEEEERHETGSGYYYTPVAKHPSSEEYEEPHGHSQSQEHNDNYEERYPENISHNKQNRCFEANLYERMGNCSHFAALKVHTEIHHATESHMLNNIACDALNIIGTDCVKDVYDCFSKIDADQIRIDQIEEWKEFIVEMIEGRRRIKLTLDNCYQLTTERPNLGYDTDYSSNQNHENQNVREEITENYPYTQEREDVWEQEYKRHEDQPYERHEDQEYERHEDQEYERHEDQEYERHENHEYERHEDQEYNRHSYNQENYHCSDSEKQSAEGLMRTCIDSITNDVQTVTDPRIVARNLCLAKAKIDTDCVKHLKNCYSPEYINWLIDPTKNYLRELAVRKFGADYSQNCDEIDSEYTKIPMDNIHVNPEPTETPESQYYTQNLENYVDPSCSETILYERMDNCSRRTALNVWANTKDNPSSSRVSNIICDALTEIGTQCVNVLSGCFAETEVAEMRTSQIHQWIKYFIRITAGTRVGRVSLENCRWATRRYDYNEPTSRTTYYEPETRSRTKYYEPETTTRTPYRPKETTPIYYHYETTKSTPQYTEYNKVDHREEYEVCSETILRQTHEEMSNCSYSTAINVQWKLQTDYDPHSITNILCSALSIIASQCVNVLYKCYNTDNINVMKNDHLKNMQEYMLNLVKIDKGQLSLQSCEVIQGSYAYAGQEQTEERYQEYYSQESEGYTIQGDSDYGYKNSNDNRYQENTVYGNQYDTDRRYHDNTGYTNEDHSVHGYQDDSPNRYQDNAVYGNTEYTHQENTDYQHMDVPYEQFDEIRSGKACSQAKLQMADDHMTNCTRLAAHNAASLLQDIRESKNAFNILCSALTSIDSDCANLLRECHTDEYVTWMLEPMKGYLIDLGEGEVDAESLMDCKYSNRFSPYRLQ